MLPKLKADCAQSGSRDGDETTDDGEMLPCGRELPAKTAACEAPDGTADQRRHDREGRHSAAWLLSQPIASAGMGRRCQKSRAP